jgi:1,4-dihydroxy-2-naphthoate octaprenyltransferase
VVVGLGAALAAGAAFRPDTALGCLAVALLLQVVANLANDLSDFRRGADTPDRAGPTRVASAGSSPSASWRSRSG